MKYKLKLFPGGVVGLQYSAGCYLNIYDPLVERTGGWSNHWYSPRGSLDNYEEDYVIDYIKHKEAYQAEAKKLIVKSIL